VNEKKYSSKKLPATSTTRRAEVESEPEDRGRFGSLLIIALLVLLGFQAGISTILVIFSLVAILFLHELGHYLVAKKAGMKVTEFFLGFGPKLWSVQRGETEYGIKAIPAGAYVRVIGMNNLDPVEDGDEKRTYRKAKLHQRLLLASAGSMMHFLIAMVLLYFLLIGNGVRVDEASWHVRDILPNGPAEQMGIQRGDQIITIGGSNVDSWNDLVAVVEASPEEKVTVELIRRGEPLLLSGRIGTNPDMTSEKGFLGIARSSFGTIRAGPLKAIPEAGKEFGTLTKETISGLTDFFSPSGLQNFFTNVFNAQDVNSSRTDDSGEIGGQQEGRVVSVVGATRIGAELTNSGWAGLFIFLVTINVFIGFFNLIPLLPLDGGHIAVALYEGIRGWRKQRYHADVSKLLPLTYAVVLVLIAVGLAAVYLDLTDPIAL
jgi:membrane-associated protease RseP (regulator of RpoE activity)